MMKKKETDILNRKCLIVRHTGQYPFPRCHYCSSNLLECFMIQASTLIMAIIILFLLVLNISHPLFQRLGTIGIIGLSLTLGIFINRRTEEMKKNEYKLIKTTEELSKTLEHKEYINNIIQSMIETLIVITPDRRIKTVNDSTCKLLGYKQEELIGKEIGFIFLEKEIELFKRILAEINIKEVVHRNYETGIRTRDGRIIPVMFSFSVIKDGKGNISDIVYVANDITEKKKTEEEREKLIVELKNAIGEIKTLSRFLPICASCKKIRDDKGYWKQVEYYISEHTDTLFSHSICPECSKKMYDEIRKFNEKD